MTESKKLVEADKGDKDGSFDLPEIKGEIIHSIDQTPNNDYPMRIIQAYLKNCQCVWSDNTNGESINPILKAMNEHQKLRSEILMKTLSALATISYGSLYDFCDFDEWWLTIEEDEFPDGKKCLALMAWTAAADKIQSNLKGL